MKKRNQGITLVALVVTIIVLLILAAVSMNLVLGDNGIITKARQASIASKKDKENENKSLDELSTLLGQYAPVKKVNDSNPGTMAGSGSTADPSLIESIEDLVKFEQDVNNGNNYAGKTIKLGLSLDFKADDSYMDPHSTAFGDINGDGRTDEIKTELTTSKGWMPIGSKAVVFKGNLDGGNYQIINVYMDRKSTEKKKMTSGTSESNFGFIANCEGSVSNLALSGDIRIDIDAVDNSNMIYMGSLGNFNGANAKIENVMNNINISVTQTNESNKTVICFIGGLTASAQKVESCINNGNITVDFKNENQVNSIYTGGIGCLAYNNISNTVNNGKINIKGYTCGFFGGIAGSLSDFTNLKLSNVANNGEINLQQNSRAYQTVSSYIGGIVGYKGAETEIDKAINKGKMIYHRKETVAGETVNSQFSHFGGIIGINFGGKIANAINEGDMIYNTESQYAAMLGGIAGTAEPHDNEICIFENDINKGNIKVVDTNGATSNHVIQIGGILGRYAFSTHSVTEPTIFKNIYNQGNLDIQFGVLNKVNVGGLVGRTYIPINTNNVMEKGNITIPDNQVKYRGFIHGCNTTGLINADGIFLDNGLIYSGSAAQGSPADSTAAKLDMTPKNIVDKMNSSLNQGDATWKVKDGSVTLEF